MSLAFGFALPHWQAISGGFSPASLFAGGVNGIWVDPSDLTTMFTTSAGTTPVAMPGQGLPAADSAVGLMLDKSQGLVLGPNIQNGGFDTDTIWTKNGWVISGGTASYAAGAGAAIEQLSPVTLAAGDWVRVTVTISAITSGFVYAWVAGTNTSALGPFATRTSAAGTYTWYFPIATVVNQNVGIYCANGPSGVVIDNVSIQKVAGNHAIAANDSTKRPELSARVNLLTYSEEFDNAYWTKRGMNAFGSGSVANTTATLDPLGGNTADFIQENTAAGAHGVDNNGITLPAAVFTYSVYVKAATRTWAYVRLASTTGQGAYFDLSSGTVGTVEAGITAAILSVGNGWYRCSVTITTTATLWYPSVGSASGNNQGSYTGDGTSGIYIWGADLRPANIGAAVPAYQRIADANTYDTAGFPLYLRFDGIDDGMYTPANLNLSATDKVGVFAGARKLVAGTQQLVELSIAVSTNDGSFSMPSDSGTGTWATASKGTNPIVLAQSATNSYVAPVTTVNTGLHDLSLAADVARLRVNGAQVATSGVVAAGGNFGTYPLNIGVRSATSSPTLYFNGHLHGLIVVGSAVSAGNISATESWMAGKTGLSL